MKLAERCARAEDKKRHCGSSRCLGFEIEKGLETWVSYSKNIDFSIEPSHASLRHRACPYRNHTVLEPGRSLTVSQSNTVLFRYGTVGDNVWYGH